MKKNLILHFYLFFVILAMFSCSRYVPNYLRVDLTAQTKIGVNTTPEITISKSFYSVKKSVKNVVISVPAEYYEMRSVSDTKGISRSDILLKEKAAMWITEIEKVLTQNGFIVLSRQKLEEILREQKMGNVAQAASLLGADAIIQINSLDYNEKVPLDQFTDVNLKFFDSTNSGKKVNRVSINEYLKNEIIEKIRNDLIENPTAYMAILDAKIIYAKTGEIIWFYRNIIYKYFGNEDKEFSKFYLFLQNENGNWDIVAPFVPGYGSSEIKGYNEVNLQEFRGAERDKSKVVVFEMVKLICDNFIKSFLNQ